MVVAVSDRGVTVGEYGDKLVGDVSGWAAGTFAAVNDGLLDTSKTVTEKWEISASYFEQLTRRFQDVADRLGAEAYAAGRMEAGAAYRNASDWAKGIADTYNTKSAQAFTEAAMYEVSAATKSAAGLVGWLPDAMAYGTALTEGKYDDAAKALAQFTLGLLVTPLAIGFFGAFFAGPILGAVVAGLFAGGVVAGFGALWDYLPESIHDFFDIAQNWVQRRDPLILDLDGDGIETSGAHATNPILFDHDGDGIKNGTGWVSSDDGLLVLDRNSNGTIDNGGELFGDSTQLAGGGLASDGFAALADMDSNSDGAVNASDTQFANLRVWRDLNQDGISQSGELFSLASLGIASINTAHTDVAQNLANGNTITAVGSYTKTDGSTSTVGGTNLGDANLVEDTFHREFTDTIPLAAGVADLPNMQGSGKVRDLWEAANEPSYSVRLVA